MTLDLPLGFDIYCTVLAVLFGASMGSFLNCAAWRLVHGESVLRGRSHCDSCGHELHFIDLIPIFGYLLCRGRCRYCGVKLAKSHLVAELIAAAVYGSCFLRFGFSLQCLYLLILSSLMLIIAFTDLEGYIIPDRFILAGIVVVFLSLFLAADFTSALIKALLGAFPLALALLLVVVAVEKILNREAMGGGDIKLLFLTGLSLGWQLNLLCLFFACIFGIIFGVLAQRGKKEGEPSRLFPWGPAIALSWWCTILFGDSLLNLYLGFFS